MKYLRRRLKRAAVGGAAFAAAFGLGAAAIAAGTDAGASVSNSFTLDYQVGGISQTQIDTSASPTTFTVDRKVDLTVATAASASASPGASGAEVVFGVTNSGNDNIAYRLSLADVGADDFDMAAYSARYYADAGADGIFTPGVDDAGAGTAYTLGSGVTADVAPDATIWIVISGDVPGTATNGQLDSVILTADSHYPSASLDGSYSATPGSNITSAASNSLNGEADSVLADGAGVSDAANDGAYSATATYTVSAASLSASKSVAVVATIPVNCASDAISGGYATPGACIEYVISASNAAGASATATNIAISDVLPDEVQYVSAVQSGFSLAGALSTPGGGCVTNCTVGLTGASLAPGATGTITIRALVR